MKTLVFLVLSMAVLVIVIISVTLVRNQARLFQPPGPVERLVVYLTQHEAFTSDNHPFLELRTPVFPVDTGTLFEAVLSAAGDLGWQIEKSDNENLSATMVVTTPLLHFRDDLTVQVKSTRSRSEAQAGALLVRSVSRVGRADFAANAGHIQSLVAVINRRLGTAPGE